MKTMARMTTVTAMILALSTASAAGETSVKLMSDTELEILESADKGKRIFTQKGDRILVNMLNLRGETVEIKVLDSEKRILFSEVIDGEITIEKAFNFKGAYADVYTVVVNDEEGTYSDKITIY